MTPKAWTLPAAIALTLGTASTGPAQDAQAFYKGKQIRAIVGHNVGNDYDVGTRLLAKYLPKYIPGQPTIVVQNMPQAAGIAAANFLQTQAARDGSVMGTFTRNYPNQAIMKQANVEGDPRRFNWLGATSFPGRVCVAGPKAKVRTAADLFTHELIVGGGPGVGSSNSIVPDRVQPRARHQIPHHPGLQGSAGCRPGHRARRARRDLRLARPVPVVRAAVQ